MINVIGNRMEIPLSRRKLMRGIIGALIMVAAAVWILVFRPTISNPVFNNPFVKYGVAVLAILMFGFLLVSLPGRLRDKRPGLVIDENGLHDRSSLASEGFIPWSDISGFSITKVWKQSFVIVGLRDPQKRLSRPGSALLKMNRSFNFKNYSSPIAISTNALDCTHEELEELLHKKFVEYTAVPANS